MTSVRLLGYLASMDNVKVNVVLQPREHSVGFDVICADCKAVIIEKISSVRAAYCQAGAIGEHKCDAKVLAA